MPNWIHKFAADVNIGSFRWMASRRRRKSGPVVVTQVEILESRQTLTINIAAVLAAATSQIQSDLNDLQSEFNSRFNNLFSSEVTPRFMDMENSFFGLSSAASAITTNAVSSLPTSMLTDITTRSFDIGSVATSISTATPSVSVMTYALPTMNPMMMGSDSVFMVGDGVSFMASPAGISMLSVMKEVSTPGGGPNDKLKLNLSSDGITGTRRIEYSQQFNTPTLINNWGATLDRRPTNPSDPFGLTINRSVEQVGGPMKLSLGASFNNSGLLTSSVTTSWATDALTAKLSLGKMGATTYLNSSAELQTFDSGWQPFGFVGVLNDPTSGRTVVTGVTFKHFDGSVAIANGEFDPIAAGPNVTFTSFAAVFLRPDGKWQHESSFQNSLGQTFYSGIQLEWTPQWDLPILGNFKKTFGSGFYYSTGPVPATIYPAVPSLHEGFTVEILRKNVLKW